MVAARQHGVHERRASGLSVQSGKRFSVHPIAIAVSLIGLLCLTWLFPYTHDDWMWGSALGINLIKYKSLLYFYNGRYFGNLIVLILTRSRIIRCLVMSATIVGISFFSNKLVGRNDSLVFWGLLFFLALLPVTVRAQGIVWTSGFTNYAISTLLILVFLCISKPIFSKGREHGGHFSVPVLLLGLASTLIMENITVMLLLLSFVLVIYGRITNGKWNKVLIAFVIGACVGAVIMFSNGAYWVIAAGADEYRGIAKGGFHARLVTSLLTIILPRTFVDNVALFVALAVGSVALFAKEKARASRNKTILLFGVAMYLVLFAVFSMVVSCFNVLAGTRQLSVCIAAASMFAVLCILFLSLYIARERGMPLAIIVLGSLVVMIAPLAVVSPIGPRNFLPVYVLEAVFVGILFDSVLGERKLPYASVVLAVATVVAFLPWVICYSDCHECEAEREAIIAEAIQNDSKSIVIPKMHHEEEVWLADLVSGRWGYKFKLFYHIPQEIEIKCE